MRLRARMLSLLRPLETTLFFAQASQPARHSQVHCCSADDWAAEVQRLGARAAPALLAGALHQEVGFVSPALVAKLRRGLVDLGRAGSFHPGSSYSSDGTEDALRSAMTCPYSAMDQPESHHLLERIDDVRGELASRLGRELSPGIEAAYVIYPAGGFYRRHVDALDGVNLRGSGRREMP